ncbi:MAG: MurT ligase domain-containing protein [Clostridiales bacterium]
MIKKILTLNVSKFSIKFCRLFQLGGTSLPGGIASKMYPDILKELSKDFTTIMVTGTNGKTTTTKIIAKILELNNIKYITNKSGANLLHGITTTFIENSSPDGTYDRKTALIEVDEAAFKVVTQYLKPDYLVVTNFFRDQLDRYGELYTTLNRVSDGIKNSPDTKLILNADDSLCASLAKNNSNKTLFYGLRKNAYKNTDKIINSDAMFCIFCKTKYDYSYNVYGHLGGFSCPKCNYSRPDTQITCSLVSELNSSHSNIDIEIENKSYTSKINLPGLYNVYNALSAIALNHILNLPVEKSIEALSSFESGFGRMETIKFEDKLIKVILVKNPTGFNQVLNYLLTEENNLEIAFIINDKIADGRDISWLWDVDFEKLESIQDKISNLYTSGIRAEDMSVRLKYAGIYTDKISQINTHSQLIDTGLKNTKPQNTFYILPTYTAMLEIRKILKNRFNLKEFWK